MKPCNTCKRPLPTGPGGAYHRDRNSRDGYKGQCRACRAVQRTAYDERKVKTEPNPRRYTIDGTFTDGSRCEMTRKSLRDARALGEALYMDSRFAVRVVVRGRKTIYEDWNRHSQQEVTL